MPFIGKTPETGAFRLIDSITTSATDTYALTVLGDHYFPESARNLIVSLNGVTQAPETAYTVSGSHIVFASALTASDVIDYILVIGDAVDIGTPSDGTVGNAQLKASLDLSGKTLTLANDQISGDVIHGGTISNFASTGIDDNATSTAMTIDADENIGVGHASPVSLGAGYKNVDIRYTTGGGVTLGDTSNIHAYLFSDNNGVTLQAPGSRSIKFTTGSTTAITVDSNQNVGVGTPSPADKVHVEGGNLRVGADDNSNHSARVILNSGGASGYEAAVDFKYEGNSESRAKIHVNSSLSGLIFSTLQSGSITEGMRLDGSGNLLVGGTTNDTPGLGDTDVGASFRADGASFVSRTLSDTSGSTFYVNRNTNDGNLIQFQKNGTTMGSIAAGASGTRLKIYSQNVAGYLGIGSTDYFAWNTTDFRPQLTDSYDLGASGARFKDLYLSGGAYLGGTGSANYLDDYEEGTFTAYLGFSGGDSGGLNYTNQTFAYTKVGRLVTFTGFLTWNQNNFTSASGRMYLRGLPFTIINGGSYRGGAGIHYANSPWTNITVYQQEFRSEDGTTDMTFNFADATDGSIDSEITTYTRIALSGNFMVSGTYMTN